MDTLQRQAALFRDRKAREVGEAGQRVAVRLCCGFDLPDPASAGREALIQAVARIGRAIQRERMKAARSHWSYDLNRHIALKQAHDGLRRALAGAAETGDNTQRRDEKRSGARGRRYVWHA